MGFWTFIFNHQEWYRIYSKNCSLKSYEEWNADATANVPLGILYITIGLICELTYIPFMIVMLKHEFIQHTCYKFMFLLSVIDILVLPCNAIISGIQEVLGLHYCTNPTLFYIAGTIGTAGWYGGSITCVILGLDRFLEMCKPAWAKVVFGGRMVYFWLAIPFFYICFIGTQLTAFYNNKLLSYMFDPFAGTGGLSGNEEFTHFTFHCIHNLFVSFGLGITYTALCIALMIQARIYESVNISKHQKLMTLQSLCICLEIFLASLVYIYNQFFPIPSFISAMAHVAWIFVHGDTPIVYLCLNASLRRSVFKLIKGLLGRTPIHVFHSIMNAPSYFPNTERNTTRNKIHPATEEA